MQAPRASAPLRFYSGPREQTDELLDHARLVPRLYATLSTRSTLESSIRDQERARLKIRIPRTFVVGEKRR